GIGVIAWRFLDHHLAARHVDPADVPRLQREEEVTAARVDDRCVGSACARLVERILLHLTRTGIEPTDHALLNAGVPDIPLGILAQTVRLGVGGQLELANLSRARIETSELAGELAGPPD